jgi:hypothetical protein
MDEAISGSHSSRKTPHDSKRPKKKSKREPSYR